MRSIANLMLASLLAAACAGAAEIKITVEETGGAERKAEVVSGGIPLPEGKYKDPAGFSLADGTPVQVSPMFKYPDGSLHWVLVSIPVKLGANEKKSFTLKDTPGKAAPANPVTVKEAGDVVEVSNGLVAFKINKANFNGFDSVSYKGKEIFKAPKAGLVASGQGGPGKLTHFEYRYRGAVRTTLYLKGTYGSQKAPTWAMAITLNAGESAIHIDHNLRNGGKGAGKVSVTAPGICLGIAGKMAAAGGGNAPNPRRGSPAYGWKDFSGDADLTVFIRHGGPTGGKGVSLTYEAAVENGQLVIDTGASKGTAYSLNYGAHKITEISLVFGKSAAPQALASPLHALAPSAWYSEHDGLGVGRGFGSLADETATYKAQGWKGAGTAKKMPVQKPDPNIYKSWFDAHGTSECDQMRGLMVGYVRTGQRGFLDRAHAWSRYWQTYFLYRSDDWIYGKDGSYKTSKWGSGRCCTEGCHYYASGLFDYGLLTGDIDALEGAFDGAEFANKGWFGPYAGKKPGQSFSSYGSRAFSRMYVVVVRAYDITRNDQWKKTLVHYAKMTLESPARDDRGFVYGRSMSSAGNAKSKSKRSTGVEELLAKEGVTIEGKNCKHPKYGTYLPKCAGTWPMAMLSWATYQTWESLRGSKDPELQLLAEDIMDFSIAQSYWGDRYAFDETQKAVYYYIMVDYPIPDYVPLWKGGGKHKTDSWYTKWWPNTLAQGYKLTGDPALRKTMHDILWWGLARVYVHPPKIAEGECPKYAWISGNTKGDWISPSALALGVGAHPKKDAKPPKAISDLKAKALGGGKVELSWTAPADEGGGKLATYQVKWAHKPIVGYLEPGEAYRAHFKNGELDVRYWNRAKNVLGEPQPAAGGKTVKMVVTAEAGKCFFAVRSFDDSHNRSAMSNVVEATVN